MLRRALQCRVTGFSNPWLFNRDAGWTAFTLARLERAKGRTMARFSDGAFLGVVEKEEEEEEEEEEDCGVACV